MREFYGCLLSLGETLCMHFMLKETQRFDGLSMFHLSLLIRPVLFVFIHLLV